MTTDPNTLLANAKCLDKCIPDGAKMGILIYIFAKYANMSTDPNTLLAGAKCLNNCIPDGAKMGVLIYIATQIAGGGGGAPDYISTAGPPVGTPTALNLQNIIVDSNGRQWQYFQGAWH